jgi:catechol 2,3-dioxygenase-like lactoylglutathione lyase family enzyme
MLVVANLQRAHAFYHDLLGLPLVPGTNHRYRVTDLFELHLCEINPGDPGPDPKGWPPRESPVPVFARSIAQQVNHVSFRTSGLAALRDRLLDAGHTPFQLHQPTLSLVPILSKLNKLKLGSRSLFVQDPDGNRIGWVELKFSAVPPHALRVVRDLGEAHAFYHDILGLTPVGDDSTRLRAGSNFEIHLTQGPSQKSKFALLGGAGTAPLIAPSLAQEINHVSLAADDLLAVRDRLLDHNLRPFQLSSVACHRADVASKQNQLGFGTKSLYVEDPSGNLVEIGQPGFSSFA